ncbi:DUF3037 domain-containing protein [Acinetobacter pittii]|uniref:DUF3037 domain-containing protein n=1 Tax=Acinetobacter pittii TaxID=48296 RepID=UPI00355BEB12
MNSLNLESVLDSQNKRKIKGHWSLIQWNPDIVSEEVHNIGVMLRVGDSCNYKFLDYFDRVKCLYDQQAVTHLQDVLELVEGAFNDNHFKISEQIKVLEKGLTKGNTEEEILERLYNRVITLGKPHNESQLIARDTFSIVRNNDFIKRIPRKLREKFMKSERQDLAKLFPTETYITVGDNRLHVPIQSRTHYGSITSVVTPNINTITNNYLMAATDLMVAAKANNRKPTFFVLQPAESELEKLEHRKVDQIDSTIDSLNFKMRQQGVDLVCESNEQSLMIRMQEWAEEQNIAA